MVKDILKVERNLTASVASSTSSVRENFASIDPQNMLFVANGLEVCIEESILCFHLGQLPLLESICLL
jgi:hypothetical protein